MRPGRSTDDKEQTFLEFGLVLFSLKAVRLCGFFGSRPFKEL